MKQTTHTKQVAVGASTSVAYAANSTSNSLTLGIVNIGLLDNRYKVLTM